MLKLQLDPSYWWPVVIPVAADGAWKDLKFDGHFVRMEADAFEAFQAEVKRERLTDAQVAPRVLIGWREVCDASGQAMPFSADGLASLCRVFPGAAGNIVATWFNTQGKLAEKNW